MRAVAILGALSVLGACHRSASEVSKDAARDKGAVMESDGGGQSKTDEEIRRLVKMMEDEPLNELHFDVTSAGLRLGEMGLPAAVAVLPLLDADSETTRGRAERVLAEVVDRRLGWVPHRGFPDPFVGQEKMRVIWEANGGYHYKVSQEKRRKSIALWRQWLANAAKDGGQ